MNAVASGVSMRKAAGRFNIPFSTLKDRVNAGKCYAPKLGMKCVFSSQQGKEIEDQVLLFAKLFFGMTVTELRRVAFEFADRNGIKHNFCKEIRQVGK
ncbi:hypothetical protein PR048_013107 [Dryococelus australis]|uniref:HTH psq-type domain-containing protein n=1 Tax=Dryococelus australis TaxID=614101 RepID=A0ABQ9HRJ8_9NEOP|nr:hypothetical protein PR048_013107 [Dryococelus australis]